MDSAGVCAVGVSTVTHSEDDPSSDPQALVRLERDLSMSHIQLSFATVTVGLGMLAFTLLSFDVYRTRVDGDNIEDLVSVIPFGSTSITRVAR